MSTKVISAGTGVPGGECPSFYRVPVVGRPAYRPMRRGAAVFQELRVRKGARPPRTPELGERLGIARMGAAHFQSSLVTKARPAVVAAAAARGDVIRLY